LVSETGAPPSAAAKRMRLRYVGTCRECGAALPAGETAVYEREPKTVVCLACADAPVPAPQGATAAAEQDARTTTQEVGPPEPERIAAGAAGASAQREYQRRKAKREERIRTAHPKLGGFILAISDEPQSTTAWATGARGEELLGKRLDGLAGDGVRVLHDRRIPRTKANIDHIAVSAGGVFVIDAKRYKGRPQLRVEGGLFRPCVEKLMVGTRDQTKLVEGVHKQLDLVRAALDAAGMADVPARGVLCFVEADWPLVGGSFVIDGVRVLWPKKLAELLVAAGPLAAGTINHAQGAFAVVFPLA